MCGWTTRRLANSAIAMIGRARHRRIKKRRRYERSAGTEPVLPVVIFLTPLSSNFEIKRIGRPTFLLFAPLLKGEVKGGAPLKPLLRLRQQHKLRRLLSTTRYSQVLVQQQQLPLPLLQRLWLSQNEKIWKNHGKPICKRLWEINIEKAFLLAWLMQWKKKWRKKFY